jgi:hypothetical protein
LSDGILVKNDPEVEDLIVSIILGIEKYYEYAQNTNKDSSGTRMIITHKLRELDNFVWSVI